MKKSASVNNLEVLAKHVNNLRSKETREDRIRKYLENQSNVEIVSEDVYFRILEGMDDERYWI